MLKKVLATTALIVGTATAASAATVSITKDLSGPYSVPAIDSFTTTGANMVGMHVTATFYDGTSSTIDWAAIGTNSGGGTVDDRFSINSGNGTTFGSTWTLTNHDDQTITNLFLSGPAGNTLFDTSDPSTGTEGSQNGRDFSLLSNDLVGDIYATYSGVVGLLDATPLQDVFAFLNVDLSDLTNVNDVNGLQASMTFMQDTDNGAGGPISSVPVPAAGFLLLGALGGFGIVGRRRRRKAA